MGVSGSKRPEAAPGAAGRVWIEGCLAPLAARFETLAAKCGGGAGADAVHDLRVASRRLREGMRILKPWLPRRRRRKLCRRLRRVTRALGPTRDWDVARAFFERRTPPLLEPWPADCEDARRAVARLCRARRRESAREMRRALAEAGALKVAARVRRLLAALEADPDRDREPDPAALAPILLRSRLEAVFANPLPPGPPPAAGPGGSGTAGPPDPTLAERMHRTRIAVKRLRYALEYLHSADPDRFGEAALRAREIQNALGLHQDLRVFRRLLEEMAGERRPRAADRRAPAREREGAHRQGPGSTARSSFPALAASLAGLERLQASSSLELFHREAAALREILLRAGPETRAS